MRWCNVLVKAFSGRSCTLKHLHVCVIHNNAQSMMIIQFKWRRNTTTVFPEIFHFPITQNPWEKQGKFSCLHTIAWAYRFGKPNTLIACAACKQRQRHTNKMVFPHGHTTTKHFPMHKIFSRFERVDGSEMKREQIGIIRCSLYLWKNFTGRLHFFVGEIWKFFPCKLDRRKTHPPATNIICIFYGGFISASP